jgi:hypothetical protein
MKCVVTPDFSAPPIIENEAEGFKTRVNASVINGTTPQGSLNLEVVVPFASSSTQMESAVRTRVQAEFARIGVTIATSDIKLHNVSVS